MYAISATRAFWYASRVLRRKGKTLSKVLILGAGASHGHGVPGAFKPPRANGFFDENIYHGILERYRPLVNLVEDEIGLDLQQGEQADIELVFSRLEPFWKLHGHRDMDSETISKLFGRPFAFVSPPTWLHSYITDLISETTWWLTEKTCPYHGFIAQEWLTGGDTVISFNYDLIMDVALGRTNHWHPTTGYGWADPKVDGLGSGRQPSRIALLKLHGSMNWFQGTALPYTASIAPGQPIPTPEPSIRIVAPEASIRGMRPLFGDEYQEGGPRLVVARMDDFELEIELTGVSEIWGELLLKQFEGDFQKQLPLIILPSPYKSFDEMTFAQLGDLWHQARMSLEVSDIVVSCGFSYRDTHFNEFIRQAARARKEPLHLCVATRWPEEVERLKKTFLHDNIRFSRIDGWLAQLVAELGYRGA